MNSKFSPVRDYYTLYRYDCRLGCFSNGLDMIEYVRRSIYDGCSPHGWRVVLPGRDTRPHDIDITYDVRISLNYSKKEVR